MRKLLSIVLSLLLLVLPLTVSAAAPKQNGTIYIPKEIKGDTASCSFSYRKGENKLTLVGTGNLGGLYRYPFAVQQNTNRQNIALLSNGWTDVLWAMSTAVRTGKVQNIILSNGTRSFSRNGKNQVESCSSSGVDSHYRYDSRGRLTSVILDDRSRYMGGDCSKYYYGYQDVRGVKKEGYVDLIDELKTAFQDPEGNLYKLQNFLEDSRPILWWAVTGPGGSGKSRLCYELARSLNSSWRCKLLLVGELEKKNLQALYEDAGRDFLLLADYAYANTYELGEWMYERAHAVDVMDKPRIRVLLLQRETGKEYFGWLESLLRGHGNLIKLRYQPDLKLIAPGPEGTEALMRSYAENEGGRQIDAKALYTVLKKVDPGLTRPLFAMFITDAAINGDNPYRWEPEDALRHFTQREMDVVEREMIVSEHIRATKLLLTLATIVNGFSFDAELLDSSPLREIWELRDLTDKVGFVNKLYNAGLVDRMYGKYIMKPLKPDLLGEYYVLNSFREMI